MMTMLCMMTTMILYMMITWFWLRPTLMTLVTGVTSSMYHEIKRYLKCLITKVCGFERIWIKMTEGQRVFIVKHNLKLILRAPQSPLQVWSHNAIARETVTSFESKKGNMIKSEKHHFHSRQWWSTNVIVGPTRLTSLLMVFPCHTGLPH